jgi:hypothetical protein
VVDLRDRARVGERCRSAEDGGAGGRHGASVATGTGSVP